MLTELSLVKRASHHLKIGQLVRIETLSGPWFYEVAKIDREQDKVWGYIRRDIDPHDHWWLVNRSQQSCGANPQQSCGANPALEGADQ